jgi:hypothetical protein
VSFSGDAPVADYDAALESISFRNTSDNPDTTQRVFTFLVNDQWRKQSAARRLQLRVQPRLTRSGVRLVPF